MNHQQQKEDLEAKEATHVYVRVDNPKSLMPKYSGPFEVVSRPSDSTIQIKTGNYVSGKPKLELHTWARAKPAFMRPDAEVAQRPRRGRPSKSSITDAKSSHATDPVPEPTSTEETQPVAVTPPPIINNETEGNITSDNSKIGGSRPIRSTRNPSPMYVDTIATPSAWSASRSDLDTINSQITNYKSLQYILA